MIDFWDIVTLLLWCIGNSSGVPVDYCFHNLNTSNCGLTPTPVFTYYKPGSRCEISFWKGCPTFNKFEDEFECSDICIARFPMSSIVSNEIYEHNFDVNPDCSGDLVIDDCGKFPIEVFTFDRKLKACVKKQYRGCKTKNVFTDKKDCDEHCITSQKPNENPDKLKHVKKPKNKPPNKNYDSKGESKSREKSNEVKSNEVKSNEVKSSEEKSTKKPHEKSNDSNEERKSDEKKPNKPNSGKSNEERSDEKSKEQKPHHNKVDSNEEPHSGEITTKKPQDKKPSTKEPTSGESSTKKPHDKSTDPKPHDNKTDSKEKPTSEEKTTKKSQGKHVDSKETTTAPAPNHHKKPDSKDNHNDNSEKKTSAENDESVDETITGLRKFFSMRRFS